jgi:nucleotide-binding universal stress UspA family protein
MLSLKHVLLPTDFSPRATGIAPQAIELARHFEAKLTLLHVLPPINIAWTALDDGGTLFDQLLQAQREVAQKQLGNARNSVESRDSRLTHSTTPYFSSQPRLSGA